MASLHKFEGGLARTDVLRRALDVIKTKVAATATGAGNSAESSVFANLGVQAQVAAAIAKIPVATRQLTAMHPDGSPLLVTGETADARKLLEFRERDAQRNLFYPRLRRQLIKDGVVDQVFSRWPGQNVVFKSSFAPLGDNNVPVAPPIFSAGQPIGPEQSMFSPAMVIDASEIAPSTAKGGETGKDRIFTVMMTYLDKPDVASGSYNEYCHWLVTDVKVPSASAGNKYLYIPRMLSPYVQLSGEIGSKLATEEANERLAIEKEFKSQYDEVNRDPTEQEIAGYYKTKNPVAYTLASKVLDTHLESLGLTKENAQEKLFATRSLNATVFDKTSGQASKVSTGNVIFHYLPPHPAIQYPKRKQRYLLYLIEQEKELGSSFAQKIETTQQQTSIQPQENVEDCTGQSMDRASFLPYLKFESETMKSNGMKLAATNYVVSMHSRGSETLYKRLGEREPIFGTKPTPKQFEKINNAASKIDVTGFENKPTRVSVKDVLAEQLEERLKKQRFFVYEQYKRHPKEDVFERAGKLIAQQRKTTN